MKTAAMDPPQGLGKLFWEALIGSWLATVSLALFVLTYVAGGDPRVSGLFLLAAAVLGMNGLARTDLWFTSRGMPFWEAAAERTPLLKPLRRFAAVFHFISNEGELAGIFVGVVALITLYFTGSVHVVHHFPFAEAFTLLGIMSAANLMVAHMMPVMAALERMFGIRGAIIAGSIISSFTGEPAAAVFLSDYLLARVPKEKRGAVATGLAATIGSGGGLMYFAAPPILIVWGTLSSVFGWHVGHLILFVGIGCVMHVWTASKWFAHHIDPATNDDAQFTRIGVLSLILLAGLVAWHVFFPGNLLWVVDGTLGLVAYLKARELYKDAPHEQHEEAFTAMYQPVILAVLLIMLEIIGAVGDPLIVWLAGFIPSTMSPLLIGYILFIATAVTSHFADNALASRVFMAVPVAFIQIFGMQIASFLAACVVMGALFGGFLLIPANLPNFYISRVFGIKPAPWLGVSWRLYPTGIAYVIFIAAQYGVMMML